MVEEYALSHPKIQVFERTYNLYTGGTEQSMARSHYRSKSESTGSLVERRFRTQVKSIKSNEKDEIIINSVKSKNEKISIDIKELKSEQPITDFELYNKSQSRSLELEKLLPNNK